MKDVDKARFLDAPHLPGRAVWRHRRGVCPAVLGGTAADEAIQHILPRCDEPSTISPVARPQSARPPVSSRAAPPQAESTPRPAHRASTARPQVVQEVDEAALILREEIAVLLAKDAIEPVPPAEMRQGFTALTSSYPSKVVAFGQSWICES